MINNRKYDVIVIGAGFFGMSVAEYMAKHGKSVLLCERSSSYMTRASYNNQARVHNGYHYPRSILTAMRSHASFPSFIKDFDECIYKSFDKYYGVARILSKVNAAQFHEFCTRACGICEEASPSIKKLFNPKYIENVFKTEEYAFDAIELSKMLAKRLSNANVETAFNASIDKILCDAPYHFVVSIENDGSSYEIESTIVFNCTYANLNGINYKSNIDLIPLKYEMTEMALVEAPEEIVGNGFTIMCGPFFSIMPFPTENLYSFSHVRYTPHCEWYDDKDKYENPLDIYDKYPKNTFYEEMLHDAVRYMPCMSKCSYQKSIWEVKTILPSSEIDDSRPILFKVNYKYDGYNCIIGGKIDNVYDMIAIFDNNKGAFKL